MTTYIQILSTKSLSNALFTITIYKGQEIKSKDRIFVDVEVISYRNTVIETIFEFCPPFIHYTLSLRLSMQSRPYI